jgi:peptide-methionine (S)-S-oxide reductase
MFDPIVPAICVLAEASYALAGVQVKLIRYIISLSAAGMVARAALPGAANMTKPASPASVQTERATLAGGCFWCLDAVFENLNGVISVTSGYAGGTVPHPTYKQVCTGLTGHAEVVQIEFDPAQIRYADLLEVFWAAHDPTTLNRQGPDTGTQYRSAIFYVGEDQRQAAERSKTAAASQFNRPIVTEIKPLTVFYPAERYHQHFYRDNPNYPYCAVHIRPKLEKLKEKLRKAL